MFCRRRKTFSKKEDRLIELATRLENRRIRRDFVSHQQSSSRVASKTRRVCPGTKVEERLARGERLIYELGEACRKHDIAYAKYKVNKTDIKRFAYYLQKLGNV